MVKRNRQRGAKRDLVDGAGVSISGRQILRTCGEARIAASGMPQDRKCGG